MIIKNWIRSLLSAFGFTLLENNYVSVLEKSVAELAEARSRSTYLAKANRIILILKDSPLVNKLSLAEAFRLVALSKSQLGQDVLALSLADPIRTGFFVEFGATNGIDISNTYVLEKHYGWNGILCEPAPVWQSALTNNRSAALDFRCVYSHSGATVVFSQTNDNELSTISDFASVDHHRASRQDVHGEYLIQTVSLGDLLEENQAPPYIDYLSVDTEGSEYEILSNFDFSSFRFGLISVEHNYTKNRDLLHSLLTANGYRRIL